jgi:hypothetical protein
MFDFDVAADVSTNVKSSPLEGFCGGALEFGCSDFFDDRLSKKPPPLNGGGEDT